MGSLNNNNMKDSYQNQLKTVEKELSEGNFPGIQAENVLRMRLQNRFRDGVSIARAGAQTMRADMAAYDADRTQYTQSLGAWHGFLAQQMMLSAKQHLGSVKRRYIYLSGWMVAACLSKFGPLPDQSMHEKTAVPDLITEIYTFLKQADALELRERFEELDAARRAQDAGAEADALAGIDGFESHVVPMIADIDAGFGNEEATYLLAKKMIEAGACAIQLENQVSDAKQCGHQGGKVTCPNEVFLAKLRAVRHAFLELGVDGVIVARTDSLGAMLTNELPVPKREGDLAARFLGFLDGDVVQGADGLRLGDVAFRRPDGALFRPKRLPNGLYCFRGDSGEDRVVMDCIAALDNGADLCWIETPIPDVAQIKGMVDRIREKHPKAKLVYNNSPSFNWTLKLREAVFADWKKAGKDVAAYPDPAAQPKALMGAEFDGTELGVEADRRIREFQRDASMHAGVFHHLITLPSYHYAALATNDLAKGYFGHDGMLHYVLGIQRAEIRKDLLCVKHQFMAGTPLGDDHKRFFAGADKALVAGTEANTMNQF